MLAREHAGRAGEPPVAFAARAAPVDAQTLPRFLLACRGARVAVSRVRALAGVDPRSFKTLRAGRARRSADMLARLFDALERIKAGAAPRRKPDETGALFRATQRVLATENALTQLSAGARPIAEERIASYAIYLLTVELEVENATLARALGCKRQHVHQTRARVEAWRDEPAVASLIERVAAMLRGVR